jgi:uncharacterized protein YaaW (UPF0174 family)
MEYQMAYRPDPDLEFFARASSADLEGLVSTLTHDKDGAVRYTEELTQSALYKQYHPDHGKYWQLVAAELQGFGANSFATMFRGGKGVLYKEILIDVCDKLNVKYKAAASVEVIEQDLMLKILTDAIERMSVEEVRQMAEEAGVANFGALSKDAAFAAFIAVFRAGGFKSFQILVIVVNIVLRALIGRGLGFAATGTMMRTASILVGPVGWAVTGLWTAFDVASPAYRVTIPAVIQVVVLRQKVISDSPSGRVHL